MVTKPEKRQSVPEELQKVRQWMCWQNVNGQKRPCKIDGKFCGSTHRDAYVDYASALEATRRHDNPPLELQLAFCFTEEDPYVGIDLDDCIDDKGEVKVWAVPIVEALSCTYGEFSPSGTGIKFFARGVVRPEHRHTIKIGDGQVEMYSSGRFFAVTQKQFGDCQDITDVQDFIDAFQAKHACVEQDDRPNTRASHHSILASSGLERRVQDYTMRAEPAEQGNRNASAFRLAGHLHSFRDKNGDAPSQEVVINAMREWNSRCSPPMEDEELLAVTRNARVNGTPRPLKYTEAPVPPISQEDTEWLRRLRCGSLPAVTSVPRPEGLTIHPSTTSGDRLSGIGWKIKSLREYSVNELKLWGTTAFGHHDELAPSQLDGVECIMQELSADAPAHDGSPNPTEVSSNSLRRFVEWMTCTFTVGTHDSLSLSPPDLLACCCRAVQIDVNDSEATQAILAFAKYHGARRSPTRRDIELLLREADRIVVRGQANQRRLVEDGQRDPKTGRMLLSPLRGRPTAEAFLRESFERLMYVDQEFLYWDQNRNCYRPIAEEELRCKVQSWLDEARQAVKSRSKEIAPDEDYLVDFHGNRYQLVQYPAHSTQVSSILQSIRDFASRKCEAPTWLMDNPPCSPHDILAFPGGLLRLSDGHVMQPTPLFFTRNAIEFRYDPQAPPPIRFLRYLEEIFAGDAESIGLVQEMLGYLLTSENRYHKIFYLVGPPRSGKSTLAALARQLVGCENTASPTMSNLASEFGLAPLCGKSLAMVSDARFVGRDIPVAVERLLTISGGDRILVNRKNKDHLDTRLKVRFLFISNELPGFKDDSGAIVTRMVLMRTRMSMLGSEDRELLGRLFEELPSILNWAIEGLRRLRANDRFSEPESSRQDFSEMYEDANPLSAFLSERCETSRGANVYRNELYEAYRIWALETGEAVMMNSMFGKKLRALIPDLGTGRDSRGRYYTGLTLRSV